MHFKIKNIHIVIIKLSFAQDNETVISYKRNISYLYRYYKNTLHLFKYTAI